MEDVIVGLLFVFFFVIRPILKQARKAAQKGEGGEKEKTKPPPGRRRKQVSLSDLFAKAQEKLRELAEQAEEAKRAQGEQPGVPAENNWEDLFSGPAREPEPWEMEASSSGDELADGRAAAEGWAWEPAPVTARPASAFPPEEPEPPPLEPSTSPVPGSSPRRRSVQTGVDLRQAVIWSEILGPPVSLRE